MRWQIIYYLRWFYGPCIRTMCSLWHCHDGECR